ncbi:MAG: AsmA-like C-terminal region-containing protein, partial [Pseudomonadota bacterium]
GDLRRARLNRVDTGWFRGPVVFTGRGRDVPPAIAIQGGTADLRQALLIGEDSGGDGDSAPLDVALSRLVVTDGIALTDLRATLRGGGGQFRGSINGAQPIEGVLAPQSGGSAVQIRSSDAGAVLRAADFFKDARGGDLSLTLRPTDQDGQYSGALRMANLRVRNAPALASLLQALSVVGILEQLGGDGLFFQTVESDFTLRPNDIVVRRASAVGPSMSITADGTFDSTRKALDMQGVISPIYLVNGLFGALFARRDEGLFGFTYRLQGAVDNPQVSVNPLSILTPGVFRDIFRRPPPEG